MVEVRKTGAIKRLYASGPDGMRLSSAVHLPATAPGSTCFAASIYVISTLVILLGFSRPGRTEEHCQPA